jgi:SWI/SNF-related matrix-associated actin-dependent regulator of chromatin subfamily A3
MAGTNPDNRHQQEALDFMIQREQGPIPAEFSLWQPVLIEGKEL